MKCKKLLSIVAIGILSAAVLAGCAGLTDQPKRTPAPSELPQIYRNY